MTQVHTLYQDLRHEVYREKGQCQYGRAYLVIELTEGIGCNKQCLTCVDLSVEPSEFQRTLQLRK